MGVIPNEANRFLPASATGALSGVVSKPRRARVPTPRQSGEAQASTFIQVIETRWTKQSRGAPQSAIRNAVPMIFRTPADAPQGQVLMHRAMCCETQGFSPRVGTRLENFSTELAEQYRLAVHPEPHGVRIEFFGAPFCPTAGISSDSVVLSAGMWLRIIANRRVAIEDSWAYYRFVYNIAHCEPGAVNTLLGSIAPVLSINRETLLW